MGIDDFDELVQARTELAEEKARCAALERRLRALIGMATRGFCPPDRACAAGMHKNCRLCWEHWAGLPPAPVQVRERERERERRF